MTTLFRTMMTAVLISVWSLIISTSTAYSAQTPPDISAQKEIKLFVVHSYHASMPWVQEYYQGLTVGFSQSSIGSAITIKNFYMDTKRRPELAKEMGEKAYKRYLSWQPDLVIACDDNAQKFFVKPFLLNRVATPVIFLGINEEPETYGYPGSNVTGVLERGHTLLTLELLRRLAPVNRIAVLNDDSLTGRIMTRRIEKRLKNSRFHVIGYYNTDSFSEWKRLVQQFQESADAIYIRTFYTLRDEKGRYVPISEVTKWLVTNSMIPEATHSKDNVKLGLLCSVAQDGFFSGLKASKMAIKALKGTPISEIPMEETRRGVRVINRSRAQFLNIHIPSYLLEGTIFYDSPFLNTLQQKTREEDKTQMQMQMQHPADR